MVGTLHFGMCRNVPKRCVVSGVLVSSVLFSYKVLDTEAPMLALPLRLPTAPYGGHMGHFLLSMLMLSGSAPFGNMAPLSVELNSKYLVQDRPHKLYEDVIPALDMGLWPSEVTNGSFLVVSSIGSRRCSAQCH